MNWYKGNSWHLSLGSSAITGAVFSLLPPISGLFFLKPDTYGFFSAIYLCFAFGISSQYSITNEVWLRRSLEKNNRETKFFSATFWFSIVMSLFCLVFAAIFADYAAYVFWFAVTIFLGLLRSGARYYRIALGHTKRVVLSDFLGIIFFILIFLSNLMPNSLCNLVLSWGIANVVSASLIWSGKVGWPTDLFTWIAKYKNEIIPLFTDSLLLDFGAIGIPFLMLGLLGVSDFGIYRGISSAAVIVRLLLDPIRSQIGQLRIEQISKIKSLLVFVILGCSVSLVTLIGIEWIAMFSVLQFGTLPYLLPWLSAITAFTFTSFVTQIYYVAARTQIIGVAIVSSRIIQTVLVSVGPIFGAVFDSLHGAVIGFCISSFLSMLVWILAARPRWLPQ